MFLKSLFIFQLFLFFFLTQIDVKCQTYENNKINYIPKNRRIFEHAASKKCLTVAREDFRLVLDKCNYDLEEPTVSGVFQVVKSNRGGHMMRWSSRPIPGAIQGCFKILNPETETAENEISDISENLQLFLAQCDTRDEALSWVFESVEPSKFLIRKFPDGPCVGVGGAENSLKTVACNIEDKEQHWKICENLNYRKCDI